MVISMAVTKPTQDSVVKTNSEPQNVPNPANKTTVYADNSQSKSSSSNTDPSLRHFEVMGIPSIKIYQDFLEMHIN